VDLSQNTSLPTQFIVRNATLATWTMERREVWSVWHFPKNEKRAAWDSVILCVKFHMDVKNHSPKDTRW